MNIICHRGKKRETFHDKRREEKEISVLRSFLRKRAELLEIIFAYVICPPH